MFWIRQDSLLRADRWAFGGWRFGRAHVETALRQRVIMWTGSLDSATEYCCGFEVDCSPPHRFFLLIKWYFTFFSVRTIVIDRFLCPPDDTANISYDVQADFLEGEKMPLASAALRQRGKTVCVCAANVTRAEQRNQDECLWIWSLICEPKNLTAVFNQANHSVWGYESSWGRSPCCPPTVPLSVQLEAP